MPIRGIHIDAGTIVPLNEIEFRFSRSTGPGGQNVNKVSTRVELLFNLHRSASLTDAKKRKIAERMKSRIDGEGIIHVTAQESRSQWRNREEALQKFADLLRAALVRHRERISTKPTLKSRERKATDKRLLSRKKSLRRRIDDE